MNDLMKAYDEYIELLEDELNRVTPLLWTHGWKSEPGRVKKGAELRERIKRLKGGML